MSLAAEEPEPTLDLDVHQIALLWLDAVERELDSGELERDEEPEAILSLALAMNDGARDREGKGGWT